MNHRRTNSTRLRRRRIVVMLVAAGAMVGPSLSVAATGGALAASAAADPAPASGQVETLTLAVADAELPAVPNAIGTLAATHGFYEARGLDVEVVRLQGTPQVVAALQAGDADVGNIGTSDLLALVGGDLLDLVAINSSQTDLSFLIAADSSITSPADLEGQTYAISQEGGLDATMARLVLTSLGVDVNEVDFVAVGDPAARAQAIANNVVTAGTMSVGTYQSIADNPDVAVLVDPPAFLEAAPIVQKVNVVAAETTASNASALEKFVAAQMEIARVYAADPAQWAADVAAERPDLEEEALASITDFFSASWCVNGCLNEAALQETSEFLFTTDDLADIDPIGIDEWVDQTFVDAAIEELGVYEDAALDPR